MRILSKLSPAETMMIIKPSSQFKDQLKFTFMDLVLKQVLEIREEIRKAHPSEKRASKYNYVIPGKNFLNYVPKAHEEVFLKGLNRRIPKVLFKTFVKLAYDRVPSETKYNKMILSSPAMTPYIKRSIFQVIFGGRSLTPEGQQLKHEVMAYFRPIDANLSDIFTKQPEKALEILMTIGGNIFLLNNLDPKLLGKIDKALAKQYRKQFNNDDSDNDLDLEMLWYIDVFDTGNMFDNGFDSFDSTYDSFDSTYDSISCSSYDSSCSSGCSGCGGCGGCGGCS